MREFSVVGERLARLETTMASIARSIDHKGETAEVAHIAKRVDAVEQDLSKIKELLSQWRGAAIILGLVWPLLLQWIQKQFFGN
jgi:predicted trehalose synthase